ncbi:MAG: coenzyme F420-0:L-glutamate ligase [Dermatophilaceae bacterium]|jgi:coenzyme F420-0:L-glutamate ligase/coenzyme F420-1:gamma-L-glutamate ligase|nr:coenzyme F420-0:L-glutamate ligase [Dermatophilaceae bacterium]
MTGSLGSGAVTIIPLHGIPEIAEGDDLAAVLAAACVRAGVPLTEGDILAVSSKIVSKALGLTAPTDDKEAVVAAETVRVVAERAGASGITRIVQGKAGPVMAAAGVDASNTGGRDVLLLLPHDPDAVCRDLHAALRAATGVEVFAVVLTDTAGRPWREGQVDFALGSHGLRVLDDLRGSVDADGRALEVTARAVADEIAAAADLVKGKAAAIPAALVRGLAGSVLPVADDREGAGTAQAGASPQAGASRLVRVGDGDWFALGSQEAVRAALGVPPGPGSGSAHGPRPVAGDTLARRVIRALDVAFRPHLDDWHGGVAVAGPPGTVAGERVGDLVVSGSNAFRVGVVAARLQVALRGEGVAFEVDPEPTVDAAGEWRATLRIGDGIVGESAG